MEKEQWSSTIVASDGLAFARTAAGVLVRLGWHAGSWDMRLGGQQRMEGNALYMYICNVCVLYQYRAGQYELKFVQCVCVVHAPSVCIPHLEHSPLFH